jgi:hypothetical protein
VAVRGDTVVVAGGRSGYSYVRSAGSWAEQSQLELFADKVSVGFHTAMDDGEIILTNIFDGSGAVGVNPAPTTLMASFSGGVYLFQ